jgi:hypothetical protein
MPTWAATWQAARSLSPVTMTGVMPRGGSTPGQGPPGPRTAARGGPAGDDPLRILGGQRRRPGGRRYARRRVPSSPVGANHDPLLVGAGSRPYLAVRGPTVTDRHGGRHREEAGSDSEPQRPPGANPPRTANPTLTVAAAKTSPGRAEGVDAGAVPVAATVMAMSGVLPAVRRSAQGPRALPPRRATPGRSAGGPPSTPAASFDTHALTVARS